MGRRRSRGITTGFVECSGEEHEVGVGSTGKFVMFQHSVEEAKAQLAAYGLGAGTPDNCVLCLLRWQTLSLASNYDGVLPEQLGDAFRLAHQRYTERMVTKWAKFAAESAPLTVVWATMLKEKTK